MALAKIYDTSDTLMVPMDLEDTEGLVSALYDGAAVLDNLHNSDSPAYAELLRKCAERVVDARISAGLGA